MARSGAARFCPIPGKASVFIFQGGWRWKLIAIGAGPCGPPLARIRTCGITAYGSYLGCNDQTALRDKDCRDSGRGKPAPTKWSNFSHVSRRLRCVRRRRGAVPDRCKAVRNCRRRIELPGTAWYWHHPRNTCDSHAPTAAGASCIFRFSVLVSSRNLLRSFLLAEMR